MHYHCEIWVPKRPASRAAAESLVAEIMEPYNEQDLENGWWDWYVVGGRWTGAHTPSYIPCDDPKNQHFCSYCEGTGTRKDTTVSKLTRGCNACGGTGIDGNYHNVPHSGDVMRLDEIPENLTCETLIVNGEVLDSSVDNVKKSLHKEGIKSGYLITVDYHC